MAVWFNGRRLFQADTSLQFERYGTLTVSNTPHVVVARRSGPQLVVVFHGTGYSQSAYSLRIEATRVDQVLVDLPPAPGDNHRLVWLDAKAPAGAVPWQFHFSSSPNVVPRLWARLRDVFPPWEYRL